MPVLGTNRSGWTVYRQHHVRELQWSRDKVSPSAHVPLRSGEHGHREPLVARSRNAPILVQGEGNPLVGYRVEVPSIYQKGPSSAATSQFPFCIPPVTLGSEVCTFSHSSCSAENFPHLDSSQESPWSHTDPISHGWLLVSPHSDSRESESGRGPDDHPRPISRCGGCKEWCHVTPQPCTHGPPLQNGLSPGLTSPWLWYKIVICMIQGCTLFTNPLKTHFTGKCTSQLEQQSTLSSKTLNSMLRCCPTLNACATWLSHLHRFLEGSRRLLTPSKAYDKNPSPTERRPHPQALSYLWHHLIMQGQ